MHRSIPTIIVDPIMLFREGLRRILNEADFQTIWCGDSPPIGPLPNLSDHASPLLVIGSDIEEAIVQIAEVKRHYPTSRVVLLMDTAPRQQLVTALRRGADTLVFKGASCETLIGTLRLVLDGAAVFPTELMDVFLEAQEAPTEITYSPPPEMTHLMSSSIGGLEAYGLSARELGVLHKLLDGGSNKEIARDLGITEATVKVHVKAILRKSRVRNRTQVAMWAYRLGLGAIAIDQESLIPIVNRQPKPPGIPSTAVRSNGKHPAPEVSSTPLPSRPPVARFAS